MHFEDITFPLATCHAMETRIVIELDLVKKFGKRSDWICFSNFGKGPHNDIL